MAATETSPELLDETPPPGSQLQCRLSGQQLVLEIPPCSSISVAFVGSFPLIYLGGLVVFAMAAVFFAIRDGEFWSLIPLGLLWPIGLGLFYLWLRGRFGKTHVLIEPARLVTRFELFGRERTQEYSLDQTSGASLVADFWLGFARGINTEIWDTRQTGLPRPCDDNRGAGQIRKLPFSRRKNLGCGSD